ncbi:MAG TPA: xanthine dehydrogenase family protein subunit M [bacterium]|nr:xanthine dehydrogenase family protein subunit M [bacterium]
MLRLPPFRYIAPASVDEAARILSEHGPEATVVAGGTDLYPNMKRRQMTPSLLVGLRGLRNLRGIRGDKESGIAIGAGTTLTEINEDPRIQEMYPALAKAAGWVSTPQLRNMGTIGGNICLDTRCNYYNQSYFWRKAIGFCMKKDGDICLVAPGSPRCWAISSSDTVPVLMSLGATVSLRSVREERQIPVASLFQDDGIVYLTKAPDEILLSVSLPPVNGLKSTYWKLRRRGSFDFPVLGVAAALSLDESGNCDDARLVLGAVGSEPHVIKAAKEMLLGQKLTPEIIESVAEVASKPSRPLDNSDLDHGYRKRMTRVFVTRALRELAGLPIPRMGAPYDL